MSTSTSSATNKVSNRLVTSSANKQVIRQKIVDCLTANFAGTLAQAPDIVNVFMALIQMESSFNPSAHGIDYGKASLDKLLKYSAIQTKYGSATALERTYINQYNSAYGLSQVSGSYCVKGAGPGGKCEFERLRSNISGALLIEPGVDVATVLIGENNTDNQILAGLIVLEDKYKVDAPKLIAKGTYNNMLTAAVAAYLGLGDKDGNGMSPEVYANSIIRGDAYRIANNGIGPTGLPVIASAGDSVENIKSPNGPTRTLASGNKLSVAGC